MIHHILWQSFMQLINFLHSVITTQLSFETKLTNLARLSWRSLTLVHLERLSMCLCKLGLYAVILPHEERCKKYPAVGVRLQHHKSTRPHGTSHHSLALTKFSSRQRFLTKNGATVQCDPASYWICWGWTITPRQFQPSCSPDVQLKWRWCVKCCREKYYSVPCPWPRITTLEKNGALALVNET